MVSIEGDDVSFTWKDYKDCGKKKVMKLNAEEFIRRFLLHVLPKGFCKIRYYGIFASRNRATALSNCKKAIGRQAAKASLTGLAWQDILRMITGKDVTVCPICKKGKMVTVEEFTGCRAPPA